MPRGLPGLALLLCTACGDSSVPSPFQQTPDAEAPEPAGGEAGAPVAAAGAGGAQGSYLGEPCLDDEQCVDSVSCTVDVCDPSLGRCRHEPDHALCADGSYCNGVELCDLRLGCVAGEPVSCSDGSACTVDRCVEAERSCEHLPRDADGDGDPDLACAAGGDCNDADPLVSSFAVEVCSNGRDDDCDGTSDESDCQLPQHDTCADPLVVDQDGTYEVAVGVAGSDYAASCASGGEDWQDVVIAVVVEEQPADVDLVVSSPAGRLALAAVALCGDASTELDCSEDSEPPAGGRVARLRLRQLQPGNHAVYLFARSTPTVALDVRYLPSSAGPTHETCGTAAEIEPGSHTLASVVDAQVDLVSACEPEVGELVYRFALDAVQDVRLYATSIDGFGEPVLSLRDADCAAAANELSCRADDPAELFLRSLPAGTYYVAVSATGPTDVDFVLELEQASEAPPDENCAAAARLEPNTTVDVALPNYVDDVFVQCLAGAVDAAFALELDVASDVRLLQRISAGDRGAVSLVAPPCSVLSEPLACAVSTQSPLRTAVRGLDAGSYRVVVESADGNPAQVTALVRPTAAPVLVAFADRCEDAVAIGPQGGYFQGNTANAQADYEAGCDSARGSEATAPEQMLRLSLDATRRVVLDMQGSSYRTLLAVRRGPNCPGEEVTGACAAGFVPERSFLDLVLEPGDYYIQVDGYLGEAGPWLLDAFIVSP